ncbi:unnamed protein product, partial [Chrysoparadoxa australica]
LVIFSILFGGNRAQVPIESDLDIPFVTAAHPQRPSSTWGKLTKPYPTGAWFLNLVIGDGSDPVSPLPYSVNVTSRGVDIGYGAHRRTVTSKRVQDVFFPDVQVTAAERYQSHYLTSYDNLTAIVYHELQGGAGYETILARGSPYVTFEFTDATPVIGSLVGFLENANMDFEEGKTVHGNTFQISLNNFETWMIYTSESVSLTYNQKKGEIRAAAPFKGILRMALLPDSTDEQTKALLSNHAYAYPRGGHIDFVMDPKDPKSYTMEYRWEKYGFGDLLMLALPHQVEMMDAASTDFELVHAEHTYQTIKGVAKGVIGPVWRMKGRITDTLVLHVLCRRSPSHTNSTMLGETALLELKKNLEVDIGLEHPIAPDVYGFSKQCGRMARLALIAEEVHEVVNPHDARDSANNLLLVCCMQFSLAQHADLLVYDRSWGGVVTFEGLNDVHADFGNAWYNDHHFQYGYFLYAAAVVTRFHPNFY